MIQVVFATSACQRHEGQIEYAFGKNKGLPWNRISQDFLNFKARTSGSNSCVIMGRKTFESLPAPLKGRHNVVMSSKEYMPHAGNGERPCMMSNKSLFETIETLRSKYDMISVIGGIELIKEAIPLADRVVHTVIETGKYLQCTSSFSSSDMYFRENRENSQFKMVENHWWDLSKIGYIHMSESVYDRKM